MGKFKIEWIVFGSDFYPPRWVLHQGSGKEKTQLLYKNHIKPQTMQDLYIAYYKLILLYSSMAVVIYDVINDSKHKLVHFQLKVFHSIAYQTSLYKKSHLPCNIVSWFE